MTLKTGTNDLTPGSIEEVYCSPGTVSMVSGFDKHKIKTGYPEKNAVTFDKKILFAFEKDYLNRNRKRLEEMNIRFSSYEDKNCSYLITEKNPENSWTKQQKL